MAHTLGPWRWESFGVVVGRDGSPVCRLTEADDVEANARLIAAAPDLLAALKDMLAGWRYIREHHGDLYGVGWDRCEEAARAAIHAAEEG